MFTRQRHSQIRKEGRDPSIFTYPAHTIEVCRDKMLSAAKQWEHVRIHELRLPIVDRTSSDCSPLLASVYNPQSVSVEIGQSHFSLIPFSLLLVPDCLYGIRAVFIGESLLTLLFLFYC